MRTAISLRSKAVHHPDTLDVNKKKKKLFIFSAILLLYMIAWIFTATFGRSEFKEWIDAEWAKNVNEFQERDNFPGYWEKVDDVPRKQELPEMPLHCSNLPLYSYFGETFSPCPFIIVYDHGYRQETVAVGNRTILIWFFGLKLALYNSTPWVVEFLGTEVTKK